MSTSPIVAYKNAQGYVPATQRKRCASCALSVEGYGSGLQCRKGGFMVTAYSVCNEWQIRQPPGFKRPTG